MDFSLILASFWQFVRRVEVQCMRKRTTHRDSERRNDKRSFDTLALLRFAVMNAYHFSLK